MRLAGARRATDHVDRLGLELGLVSHIQSLAQLLSSRMVLEHRLRVLLEELHHRLALLDSLVQVADVGAVALLNLLAPGLVVHVPEVLLERAVRVALPFGVRAGSVGILSRAVAVALELVHLHVHMHLVAHHILNHPSGHRGSKLAARLAVVALGLRADLVSPLDEPNTLGLSHLLH